jgi:peptidyl-prolyl cis-trans isomerase SurA
MGGPNRPQSKEQRMKQAGLIVIYLSVAGMSLAAQGQTPPQTPATPPPATSPGESRIIQRILVKVNGEAFTQTDLERQQILAIKEKRPNATTDSLRDQQLMSQLEEVTPDILVQTVDELLIVQHGRELGIRMTDEKFQTFVENFKKENKINDQQLKEGLAQEGLTMDLWREQWEKSYIYQEVQREEIGQHMQLTEEERRQYYAAHPDEFKTPATVTLREIHFLVPTQTQNGRNVFSADVDAEAKAKATAARERVLKGEDFAKLATEISESPATKANGGLLGEFKLDDIDGVLREMIDKLKAGDVSEPIRTQRGWQILKVDARTEPALRKFADVQDEIFQRMMNARLGSETEKLLVRIRANALIVWYDDALKQMYEKRIKEKASGK